MSLDVGSLAWTSAPRIRRTSLWLETLDRTEHQANERVDLRDLD
jgi:hypothetical protein